VELKTRRNFQLLDSIGFSTSSLKRMNDSILNSKNKLIIGENRVEKPLVLKNRLFLPPHITRSAGKEKLLGISLGSCLAGCNLNIHSKPDKDFNEIAKIKDSPRFLDIISTSRDIDHDVLRRCDLLWLEVGIPEYGHRRETKNEIEYLPSELDEPKDLIHLVDLYREMLNIPLVVSIKGLDVRADMDNILVTSADAVHISSGYEISNNDNFHESGIFSDPVTSIVETMKHMETFKSKTKGVKLLVSGPLRNSTDIIKVLALGADGVGLDFLIDDVLSSIMADKRDVDWSMIGELVQNRIVETLNNIENDLEVIGCRFEDLNSEMLVVDDYHSAAMTGLPLAGYGLEIPFWRH
jgi:hypothetical protein